jgi:hypothetical protein
MPTGSGQEFYHHNEMIPEEPFPMGTFFNIFLADPREMIGKYFQKIQLTYNEKSHTSSIT